MVMTTGPRPYSGTAPPPVWYPDPSHRHQFRLAGPAGWSATVADNGVVTVDPLLTGPPLPPARRSWRSTWLTVCAIAAVGVLALGLVGVGMREAVRSADTYTADLARGSGDFPESDHPETIVYYDADGLHLVGNAQSWWVADGLKSPTAHATVAAEVTVRGVKTPAESEFGPVVWERTYGVSYAFTVGPGGDAALYEDAFGQRSRVIAKGMAPALGAGTIRTLMITCVIDGDGVSLAGYVDGTRVVSGHPQIRIKHVSATGMAGRGRVEVPAEWAATHFARYGPDDMPTDVDR